MHVDDCEVAGKPQDLQAFKTALVKQFGEVREQEWEYRHCGIDYTQTRDYKTLTHSQKQFIDAMKFQSLGKANMKDKSRLLNEKEITIFRSILGGLQWVTLSRADHCAECSRLQTKRNSPTVEDLKDAHALLRRCKDTASEAVLTFRKQDDSPKRILVFPDASLNSIRKKDKVGKIVEERRTQAGWLILLTSDTETLDSNNVHVLNWASRKVTRVSKSTLASEAVARVGAVEDAVRCAGWMEEIYGPAATTADLIYKQETGKFMFPVDIATDAKALHEVIISPMEPKPSDPGCLLWLKYLREMHQRKMMRRAIWTSTVDMLGDGLTKDKENSELRNLFKYGKIRLKYSSLSGSAVVDGYKGRPPTKKEREEQGYHLVDALLQCFFLKLWIPNKEA